MSRRDALDEGTGIRAATRDERTDLVFENVRVDYGERVALRELTLALDARRIAVIGPNGSGKSSFARLLNGLVTPTQGCVRVHGLDPARQRRQVRERVGFIFANADAQIVMPTVAEDVALSLRRFRLPKQEAQRRVEQVLESYGLASFADAPARELSGGQKQLLALAAVTAASPSLIVADEPTASLDAVNGKRVREALREAPQQVLVVTHDMRMAAECELVLRFDDGHLTEQGPPEVVVDRYEREFA